MIVVACQAAGYLYLARMRIAVFRIGEDLLRNLLMLFETLSGSVWNSRHFGLGRNSNTLILFLGQFYSYSDTLECVGIQVNYTV
jgi:hypothetical protein